MATQSHTQLHHVSVAARQASWMGLGLLVGFGVPYIGVSVLDLQHDVYYLGYFAITAGFLVAYVRSEQVDVAKLFGHRLAWSLGLGILVSVALVANVLSQHGTARPGGAYFLFELAWRGVGYGIIDALLLTAFPCLIAYKLLDGRVHGVAGRARYVAVSLPLVLLITGVYHLGYPQFRQDGISKPETGNTLISVPMLATLNPAGSVVAHVSMHVAAVTHSYETHVFLPPKTKA